MLSYKIRSSPTGILLADWSQTVRDLTIETTPRGYGTCTAIIPMRRRAARTWYATLDNAHLVCSESGAIVYEGRIEITETTPEGLSITAFGYSRAYSDLMTSDMWSTMDVSGWTAVTTLQMANRNDARWALDTNNRLYLAPSGGEAHDISNIGSLSFAVPALSVGKLLSVDFTYRLTAPNTSWVAVLGRFTAAYGYLTDVWTLSGNGAAQTGTVSLSVASCDRLMFSLYFNRAATTLGTAILTISTSIALAITAGVRTVTPASMTNIVAGMMLLVDDDIVDTTIAAGVAATGVQVVTPGSMANIIVGSVLDIDDFGAETVTVTAVSATTFTATYVKTHGTNSTVRRASPASEEVLVTATTATTFTATFAVNHLAAARVRRALTRRVTPASMTGIVRGGKLAIGSGTTAEEVTVLSATATSFVASFAELHATTDSVSAVWDGETGAIALEITAVRVKTTTSTTITADEVVRALVARVAAANPAQASTVTARITSPGFDLKEYSYSKVEMSAVLDQLAALAGDGWLWSWRVWENRILVFGRIATDAQTFQIRSTPEVNRDLGSLRTVVAPVYTNENGDEVLGTNQISTASELRYGLRRTAYVDAPTTSATDANTLGAAALVDASVVNAWGDITVTALWQNGQRVPLTSARSGDIIQCVEFPSTGNSETDKTRQFRVATTAYNHASRTLTLSPEQRAPTIDSLLARRDVSLVGR